MLGSPRGAIAPKEYAWTIYDFCHIVTGPPAKTHKAMINSGRTTNRPVVNLQMRCLDNRWAIDGEYYQCKYLYPPYHP